LAVLVTRSGLVRDRVLRLDLPQGELDLAARSSTRIFVDGRWNHARRLSRRIEQERSEYDRLMHSIEQLYKQVLSPEKPGAGSFRGRRSQPGDWRGRSQASARNHEDAEEKEKVAKLLGAILT